MVNDVLDVCILFVNNMVWYDFQVFVNKSAPRV